MPSRTSLIQRQFEFRRAADAVATAIAAFPHVRAIALSGSLAVPLRREVPRFDWTRAFGGE